MTNETIDDAKHIYRLMGFPLVKPGDQIGDAICEQIRERHMLLQDKDIVVVAQKIVSIAERKIAFLDQFNPTPLAVATATKTGRDPRFVQAIFDQSVEILRVEAGSDQRRGTIVTRTHLGVMTSAGIDRSNTGSDQDDAIVLLPDDPDKSAREIADCLYTNCQTRVGILIVDTSGDHDRQGAIGKAIGIANIPARKLEKGVDLMGRSKTADINIADALAAFAVLLMGEGNEATPVVIMRGFDLPYTPNTRIKDILK